MSGDGAELGLEAHDEMELHIPITYPQKNCTLIESNISSYNTPEPRP